MDTEVIRDLRERDIMVAIQGDLYDIVSELFEVLRRRSVHPSGHPKLAGSIFTYTCSRPFYPLQALHLILLITAEVNRVQSAYNPQRNHVEAEVARDYKEVIDLARIVCLPVTSRI